MVTDGGGGAFSVEVAVSLRSAFLGMVRTSGWTKFPVRRMVGGVTCLGVALFLGSVDGRLVVRERVVGLVWLTGAVVGFARVLAIVSATVSSVVLDPGTLR